MRRLWLGTAIVFLGAGPAVAEEVTLDLRRAAAVSRGVERFEPRDERNGLLHARLVGGLEDRPAKCGEVSWALAGTPLAGRRWGDQATVSAQVRVPPAFLGTGKRNWHRAHRARLFLVDARGRRQY